MTVSPLDRARPGGPGGCGWPKPPVSQNFLHSRRGSPRWLMVQPTALPCSRPDPACVQPGRSPPGPLGPPGSRAPSGRRLPQGTGQLLLPPWHRPLHLRVRAQVPRLPGIKLQPHSPPRGRARLFRCCLPVSREHMARCAVSPQTGAPSPRDHLSLSAWYWEGSQDRGQSAGPTTSPSRFPENLPQRPAPSRAHTEGPSPCPCVQEHEGPGHSRHLLGPVGVQCDASPTVPGDPSRTLLGPPPQLTPAPHPRGRSAVLQAGHPA